MNCVRISRKHFCKNCRDIRVAGKLQDWKKIQNGANKVVLEMEYSIFPYSGMKVFLVYRYGKKYPEYWLVNKYKE
jgi:hypothetical protein